MNEDIKQVLEIVTAMQEQMVSKEDFNKLERSLRIQIMDNTSAVASLCELHRDHSGFAKEIDLVMSRVAVIEQKLGIEPNIPA